jgi:hypothetical protein
MYLLKIIDNFYTVTLDGFIKRYRFEQGITGFLGLSFLSNVMSFMRNSIIYSFNFITSSPPFKLATLAISTLLESCASALSYSFSLFAKGISITSNHLLIFAQGPVRTFVENKAIPAIQTEVHYIKDNVIPFSIGAIICMYSIKSLFGIILNNDNSKKYSYPQLASLAFSGVVDCGLIYLSTVALITPKFSTEGSKLTAVVTCCFLANNLLKQNIYASTTRS